VVEAEAITLAVGAAMSPILHQLLHHLLHIRRLQVMTVEEVAIEEEVVEAEARATAQEEEVIIQLQLLHRIAAVVVVALQEDGVAVAVAEEVLQHIVAVIDVDSCSK
jgi:hypothetical protein